MDVATQNPEILPASHSLDDVRDTAQLFQSLAAIQLALQQLYKQVSDTTTKVGSDAYAVARTIYAATKAPVAGPNLTVAADTLGRRFGRKSRAAAAAADASSPTPPQPQA